MFERNGKCIFEPGDAVYVYNNFSVSKVEIVPTVVTTTILNDQGVSYYVQGERFSYHEGNTFATEEEARKWAEENRCLNSCKGGDYNPVTAFCHIGKTFAESFATKAVH